LITAVFLEFLWVQRVALKRQALRPFTESDDTRGRNNTTCPPEDEHGTARNMSRIIV